MFYIDSVLTCGNLETKEGYAVVILTSLIYLPKIMSLRYLFLLGEEFPQYSAGLYPKKSQRF